jgi:CHAD domain-containing protein
MPATRRRSRTSSTSPATRATSPSGLYDDGTPGELFITMAKEGSTVGGLMDAFGTAISLCLQYGVPVKSCEKVRPQPVRAERVHQEPGHPDRQSRWTTSSAGPGETDAVVADLRAAARATNHLRDLDVRLLAHDAYRDLLPERLRDGLEEMFADVAQERAAEHRRIAGRLRSAAYRRRMARTQAFFSQPDALPESRHARTPIRTLAGRRILRRHRRVVTLSRTLTAHSPDAALHELRLQCKKLRYLLELFAELYDPAAMARLVKRLRRLQNRLGSFHDCAVQLASLQAYWDRAATTHPQSLALTLSFGGLMGALYREQLRHRERALNALSSIRDRTAKTLFKRTFRT